MQLLKCDGLKPACQRCTKSGKICTGFPSSFKFLDNRPVGGAQNPSSESKSNISPVGKDITAPKKKSYRQFKIKQVEPSCHQKKSSSLENSHSKSSSQLDVHANATTKHSLQYQDDLLMRQSLVSSRLHHDEQVFTGVPESPFQSASSTSTVSSLLSTPKLEYCQYDPEHYISTPYSPNEWPSNSSPQMMYQNSFDISPDYWNGEQDIMTETKQVTPPNEFLQYPSPQQLAQSPRLLADEELEAYWEMLNSEYMTSCQRKIGLDSDFHLSSHDTRAYSEDFDQHRDLQNGSLVADNNPNTTSCGNWGALPPDELYLCNFFL